jgi:hypothetical protein
MADKGAAATFGTHSSVEANEAFWSLEATLKHFGGQLSSLGGKFSARDLFAGAGAQYKSRC